MKKNVSSKIGINQGWGLKNGKNFEIEITFAKMLIHSVGNDNVDRLYVALCVDPVTFCA